MSQPVSAEFETSRKNEEFPTHQEYFISHNYSASDIYGTVATASSEASGHEATYSNDGLVSHIDNYWESTDFDTYTKVLLHFNGTDTSTTFTDEVGTHTWTANGDAQIDTAKKKFGSGSGKFDGTGDYISTADHSDWNIGTGDFTIDFWILIDNAGNDSGIFQQYQDVNNKWNFQFVTGNLRFRSMKASVLQFDLTKSWSPTADTWYHIEISRSSGVQKWLIDGTVVAFTTTSGNQNGEIPDITGNFTIGTTEFADMEGQIDEFRYIKGRAIHTANFTPNTIEYGANEGWLLHTLETTKKIGFVRFYCDYNAGCPSDFALNYYDGASWQSITPTKIWGFNRNNSPVPSISNVGASITSNCEYVNILFDAVETDQIRLWVNDTRFQGALRICEMQCHRAEDISRYLYQTLNFTRQMDNTWNRFQGGQFTLELLNEDRRFSPDYTPTVEQVIAGYFNSEILPNCKILAFSGFNDENIQALEGSIDAITINSGSRTISFSGRDKFKYLTGRQLPVNQSDVTTKTIENCIEYILNKCNISSSETNLATSDITLDTFAFIDTDPSEIIYKLVEAMGDAIFMIQENGIFETKFFNNNRSWVQTTYSDFLNGTLSDTSITIIPGSITLARFNTTIQNYSFEETSLANWTQITGSWTRSNDYAKDGTYSAKITESVTHPHGILQWRWNSYDSNGTLIGRCSYRTLTVIDTWYSDTIGISGNGNQYIYIEIEVRDLTYGSVGRIRSDLFFCAGLVDPYVSLYSHQSSTSPDVVSFYVDFIDGNIHNKYKSSGNYLSQSHYVGTSITAWGKLEAVVDVPTNTTIVFKTQTSDDGSSWDAETVLSNIESGTGYIRGDIASAVKKYIRWKAYYTTTEQYVTAEIKEVVVRWIIGSSSVLETVPDFTYVDQGNTDYATNLLGSLKSFTARKSDQQGEDSGVFNSVKVRARQLFLSPGTETVWDNPTFSVDAGTYIFYAELQKLSEIDVNMDFTITGGNTKHFYGDGSVSGSYPAFVTSITVEFSNTKPKITMVTSGSGTITVFKIVSKVYNEYGTNEQNALADEYLKSLAQYGKRELIVENDFIQGIFTANDIALKLVDRFQNLTTKIDSCEVCYTPNIQLFDLVNLVDYTSGINDNFYAIGIVQSLQTGKSSTTLYLKKI